MKYYYYVACKVDGRYSEHTAECDEPYTREKFITEIKSLARYSNRPATSIKVYEFKQLQANEVALYGGIGMSVSR